MRFIGNGPLYNDFVSREPGTDGATTSLRSCCSIEPASYAKPACDVVAETRPCRFHRRLPSSTGSELSKPATLLNPGVWEFRNRRSLFIDLFRLLCHHPGFECNRRSGTFTDLLRSQIAKRYHSSPDRRCRETLGTVVIRDATIHWVTNLSRPKRTEHR